MRHILFAGLALAVLLAACGGQPAGQAGLPSQSQGIPNAPASSSGRLSAPDASQLTGAGATFPYPLYSRWFYQYASVDPSARFNYQSIGSGGGISQATAKTVDFAASDAILNAQQKAAAPDLRMFPTVAGAVVIAYNVNDANGSPIPTGLKLTPDVIAGIFLGHITKWNDPQLQSLNPDVKLPDQDIAVAHRADGSGTTFLFTSYLSEVSPEWKSKVGAGTSVQWPVGLGGKGNEGVAGILAQQGGGLGYVELAYAVQSKLAYAFVQNKAGKFVEPTLASITAASNAFGDQMPPDLGQLLVNAPGDASYPIAGYTFLLLYKDMPDCAKAQKLVSFVKWALNDGDQYATALYYAPLGANAKQKDLQQLSTLTCEGGKPIPAPSN
jgi:phosphate transport system substrate-binding protein